MRITRLRVAFFGLVVGCHDPSSGTDGGADAQLDQQTKDAAGDVAACNDASQGTRWVGWSRVVEAHPCCTVEVPDSVGASISPLTWVPCTNAQPSCREMPVTWGAQPNAGRFDHALVLPSSQPKIIAIGRILDTGLEEFDLYDFVSGAPVAGWRDYGSVDTVWSGQPIVGTSSVWVYVVGTPDINATAVSSVAHTSLTTSAHPTAFSVVPSTAIGTGAVQDFAASDTTLAFDVEPLGAIGRVSSNAPSQYVFTSAGDLVTPIVVGDSVFAKSNGGNGGWAEQFAIQPDGTKVVLRAKPNTQIDNFATDGTLWFWTEGYGGTPGASTQPTEEVWVAPYTADPPTLNTAAHKAADVSGGYAIRAVAFNGYYAVMTAANEVWVIRGSDGAKQQVGPGSGRTFASLTYVSTTELWSIAGTTNTGGIAFQRQQLASWP